MSDISHLTIRELVTSLRGAAPYSKTPDLLKEAADRLDPMQELAEDKADAQAAEIALLRDALESLSNIHDGNPSDAMADVPPLGYARHMLWEARNIARAALRAVS